MAQHLESGRWGEDVAVKYLQDNGYKILCRNWRSRRLEVDIIAKESGVLVFIEVKSRNSTTYGEPFEFVDTKKKRNLLRVAEAYIRSCHYNGEIRFDIISVYLKTQKVELIKDAFWDV